MKFFLATNERLTCRYPAAITVHGIDTHGDHAAVCIGDGVQEYYVWHEGEDCAKKMDVIVVD